MSQSATELVKGALERRVREAETTSQEPSDTRSSSTAISRSELEAAVREGVREGLSEYQEAAEGGDTSRVGSHEQSGSHYDEDDSSGGSGLRTLVLLGLAVTAVLYWRRRSGGDDYATDY